MNVRIMHLINTLKVGLNRTSRLVPVVREFSNVRIRDFQFFYFPDYRHLILLKLKKSPWFSFHFFKISRWSLIVITWHLLLLEQHYTEQPHLPTYTLDQYFGKPTSVLNKPTSFSSIHSLLTGGLICAMDMGTCKTIDLKKHIIIVHHENLSNVRFIRKYLLENIN